jgi:hypothetical protein
MRYQVIIAVCVALCGGGLKLSAQVEAVDNIRLVNTSNQRTITLSEPSTLTTNQTFTFPAAVGAVGNYLGVGSVSGSQQIMSWQTAASSGVTTSDRLTTTTSGATGTSINAEANKAYRVVGVLQMNRTAGAVTDNITITLAGTSASYSAVAVSCANCPAGTTGVPAFASGTASAVLATPIDPAGSGTTNKNPFAYSIEGLVVMDASSGTITLTIDADSEMLTHSYILITEID